MKSSLTIVNSNYLDSGSFTCSVSSDNYELRKSTSLQLNKLHEPVLSSLSITGKMFENITIDCYTNTKDYNLDSISQHSSNPLTFGYNWLKSDQLINQFTGDEIIQDLYPTGSRITILNLTRSTTYKCIVVSLLGTSSKEIFVDVMSDKLSKDDYCDDDLKDGIEWKRTIMNAESVHKCPDNFVGQARRMCMHLSEEQAASWSEVDYSNCLNTEFERLFKKTTNYFLGYGGKSFERLIDEIQTKIKIYKFRNGEAERILEHLQENNENLIKNKIHFDPDEYQRIVTKLLDIMSDLLQSPKATNTKNAKKQFLMLIFNISNQIDLERNGAIKNQKISFKNFNLFMVQNSKNDLTAIKQSGYLPLPFNSSRFSVSNLQTGDKVIFILFKVNHFLSSNKDFEQSNKSLNKKKAIEQSKGMALNFFANRNEKSNRNHTFLKITLGEGFSSFVLSSFQQDISIIKCPRSAVPEEDNFFHSSNYFPRSLLLNLLVEVSDNYSKRKIAADQLTFLEGKNKIALKTITFISCSVILIAMILNLRNWRTNSYCLAGVLKLQLCISLIINHFSTAMALFSCNQKNENYWLMLFTLSQISALTIQFCICIAIEHNFDGSKSQFAKNISYRITIVSTIVPFSLIGLIYEFYYTSYSNFLWTLETGSTLFYSIICASLLITLANLFFYIKMNSKLQPFKKTTSSLAMKSNKYENTSKMLTQTIILTILLNIHLAFVLSIINMPINVQNILIFGYGVCSFMIVFIVLVSFRTTMTKLTKSKRCSTENLSLNRQRTAFKHYNSSSEIKSIFT